MSLQKLKNNIESNYFERIYLLYGEETYLTEHYRCRIIDSFKKDGFSDFNILICHDGTLPFDEFLDFYESFPMLSSRKLLVFNDFNPFKATGEYKDKLGDLLKNTPEYLTIVFSFVSTEFKPDKRLSLWKTLESTSVVCEMERAGRSDLISWIKRRFKAFDKEISGENAEYLTFVCGNLMNNLICEIDKISMGCHGKEIKAHNIDELASPILEAEIFALTDKISQNDYHGAMILLNKLFLLKNEPIVISAILGKHIGRMYLAKLALKEGRGESFIMKSCGFRSQYPATLLCKAAGKVSLRWLEQAVSLSAQTDLQLRSNIPDNERKLELLLCRLAGNYYA